MDKKLINKFVEITNMSKKEISKNFKKIGSGSGRRVYQINEEYVLKYPYNQKGIAQNEFEDEIYNTIINDNFFNQYSKWLCPVVYYNNNIIIMKNASANTKAIWGKIKNDDRNDIYEFAGYINLLKGDIGRNSSWGILDENPVLIDYGCSIEILEQYY